MTAPDGLLVVDKPAGWTSHDVVARVRRLAATRRVGHGGTLDPMATGVLVVGLGRATKLLGHLAAHDKDYVAHITVGVTTTTDDAEGEVVARTDAAWTEGGVRAAMAGLTGKISQVPPAYSAIKVAGRRAYARARAGEDVALVPRMVTVSRFDLLAVDGPVLHAEVTCSSGTYVRALARDLGAALGTGAHLSGLRRTRVGAYGLDQAHPLTALEAAAVLPLVPLADAVAAAFPRRDVTAEEATGLAHGRPLPASAERGPVGVFAPDGTVVALVADRDGLARPLAVFTPAG
ncbi:MAG TPA: tRNA pseudouridine(55) synthase TruB [Mycobacteriales bacterium]